jgi:hypothetical protein
MPLTVFARPQPAQPEAIIRQLDELILAPAANPDRIPEATTA